MLNTNLESTNKKETGSIKSYNNSAIALIYGDNDEKTKSIINDGVKYWEHYSTIFMKISTKLDNVIVGIHLRNLFKKKSNSITNNTMFIA